MTYTGGFVTVLRQLVLSTIQRIVVDDDDSEVHSAVDEFVAASMTLLVKASYVVVRKPPFVYRQNGAPELATLATGIGIQWPQFESVGMAATYDAKSPIRSQLK